MRILVIDDDRVMRDVYQRALALDAFSVDTASDGAEGLQKILATAPDLVVLDILMPAIDGWGLLERMRDIEKPPLVVVVSGTLDGSRAKVAGVAAAFSKPVSLAELRAACVRLLTTSPP